MAGKRSDPYKKAPETLQKAIVSMQRKITKNRTEFQKAPLTIEVELGDGRTITRANPFVQEFRALVKDFGTTMKVYKEITGTKGEKEQNQLDDIRQKFKIAK